MPTGFPTPPRRRDFAREEGGFFSAFSLYVLIILILVGGLALDTANLLAARTQLQVATESAAHAALVVRQREDAATARSQALELHELNMPVERFGATLTDADIEFGRWEPEVDPQNPFRPDAASRSAVRVTARQDSSRSNALRTFLLGFAGIESFDLAAQTVYVATRRPCLTEGMVANGQIRIRSNNEFGPDYCVHSNDHVWLRNNNEFAERVRVSMPDLADLDMPGSGFANNPGLEEALREARMTVPFVDELDDIIDDLRVGASEFLPDVITDHLPVIHNVSSNQPLTNAIFAEGRIHDIRCTNSNRTLSLPGHETLRDVVIVTNCRVNLGAHSKLHNVTLASTNPSGNAITGQAWVDIGDDDNCAPGGGSRIITLGDFTMTANMGLFGSQIIAAGDVSFTANMRGIEGASIIAGGTIDATSNNRFGNCGIDHEDRFVVPTFRMSL